MPHLGIDTRPRIMLRGKESTQRFKTHEEAEENTPTKLKFQESNSEPRRRSTMQIAGRRLQKHSSWRHSQQGFIYNSFSSGTSQTTTKNNLLSVPNIPSLGGVNQSSSSPVRKLRSRTSSNFVKQGSDKTLSGARHSFSSQKQKNINRKRASSVALLKNNPINDGPEEKRKKSLFSGLPSAQPKPGVPTINVIGTGSRSSSLSSGSSLSNSDNKEDMIVSGFLRIDKLAHRNSLTEVEEISMEEGSKRPSILISNTTKNDYKSYIPEPEVRIDTVKPVGRPGPNSFTVNAESELLSRAIEVLQRIGDDPNNPLSPDKLPDGMSGSKKTNQGRTSTGLKGLDQDELSAQRSKRFSDNNFRKDRFQKFSFATVGEPSALFRKSTMPEHFSSKERVQLFSSFQNPSIGSPPSLKN